MREADRTDIMSIFIAIYNIVANKIKAMYFIWVVLALDMTNVIIGLCGIGPMVQLRIQLGYDEMIWTAILVISGMQL